MSSLTALVRSGAALVVSVVLALALVLAAAPAAQAHDELLQSTPASGERLATAPETVSLTFSDDVLTVGALVVVVDADERDWVAGEPLVDGGVVTATLAAGMPDAGYELRWRVVSADGHPISGVVPFTVGDGAALVRESAASDADGSADDEARADSQITPEWGPSRVLLAGAIGAAVAASGLALFLSIHRRRSRAGGPDEPSA